MLKKKHKQHTSNQHTATQLDPYCPKFQQRHRMVCHLHDLFRQQFSASELYLSPNIMKLPPDARAIIISRVRNYQGFCEKSDPEILHNIGYFSFRSHKLIWAIYRDDGNRSGDSVSLDQIKKNALHMMVTTAEEYWSDLPEDFF